MKEDAWELKGCWSFIEGIDGCILIRRHEAVKGFLDELELLGGQFRILWVLVRMPFLGEPPVGHLALSFGRAQWNLQRLIIMRVPQVVQLLLPPFALLLLVILLLPLLLLLLLVVHSLINHALGHLALPGIAKQHDGGHLGWLVRGGRALQDRHCWPAAPSLLHVCIVFAYLDIAESGQCQPIVVQKHLPCHFEPGLASGLMKCARVNSSSSQLAKHKKLATLTPGIICPQ